MEKKLILVDGNNLMFRSFYATAYTGNIMKNSKGFPTNALFGFASMIKKIINEENPEYMAVAFDIGKNFRKQEYSFYKEGRQDTPNELKMQMPLARDMLDAMGIKHFELEPYEADDIIGSIVKMTEADPDFASVIVSSDKDLLQLISNETEVKLLKQTGFIRYNYEQFLSDYGILPIRMIDLKALMGDSSDNIPGVKGIGEKTALKLLQEYESIESLYDNIDLIKGKTREKLIEDKEMAFVSKKIATIYKDVPLDITLSDLKYTGGDNEALRSMYQELEFSSLLKTIDVVKTEEKLEYKTVSSLSELESLDDHISLCVELTHENYHEAEVVGMGISDKSGNYYVDYQLVKDALLYLKDKSIVTYDAKKIICALGVDINFANDLMIAGYLSQYNIKDDLASLASSMGVELKYYDVMKKEKFANHEDIVSRAKFLFDYEEKLIDELEKSNSLKLYREVEMPLLYVLADMELNGVICKPEVLDKMHGDISKNIEVLTQEIYDLAGVEFNIGSPKQLGEVLFDRLELAKGKKNKTGYKTDVKVLEKLAGKHPIVEKILEYRNLSKLNSTYIEGLKNYILSDGKIHTIYKQTLTRTGRLSSTDPNLQNIPVREELGRKIREAFVPLNDYFLSADYSQVELRVMAHLSGCESLIDAFKNGEDIHTKVASSIYGVDASSVTPNMRRCAKAVIFGIIYGISGFGLSENLKISKMEADDFINKFHELYPEVKKYTDMKIKEAEDVGSVTTMFGRTRVIDEIKNTNYMIREMGKRMAMNTPIQGTSADIMKMAMINVYNRFNKENLKSKMILQVHDEIIVDLVESEEEIVKKIVKEEMEGVVHLSVPLLVDINTGINWYEAK